MQRSFAPKLLLCLTFLAFLGAQALWLPSPASAGQAPPPGSLEALPSLRFDGLFTLSEVEIELSCHEEGEEARCAFTMRGLVEATPDEPEASPHRMIAMPRRSADLLLIEGEPFRGVRTLEPGERLRFELRAARTLGTDLAGEDWIAEPMRVRHLFLGEQAWLTRVGEHMSGELLYGEGFRVEGEARVRAFLPESVEASLEGLALQSGERTIRLSRGQIGARLRYEHQAPGLLRQGGPFLAGGSDDADRFLMRLGYELGLWDFFFLSLTAETDFLSYGIEALTVEIASPSVLFFIPSFSAGLGLAVRERAEGVDAGLRLMAGASVVALGLGVALDYWPTEGEFRYSLTVRVSL